MTSIYFLGAVSRDSGLLQEGQAEPQSATFSEAGTPEVSREIFPSLRFLEPNLSMSILS